jgi:hypothetical protein
MILPDSLVRARLRSFTRAGENFRRIYGILNEPSTPGEIHRAVIDPIRHSERDSEDSG